MNESERRDLTVAALDQLPLLATLVEGPALRLVAMSQAARQLVGERQVGTPMTEWADLAGQQISERFAEVYRTGQPFVGKEWNVEFLGPDGQPGRAAMDFTVVPVRGPDGDVRGVFSVGTDVTAVVGAREEAAARSDGTEQRSVEAHEVLAELQDAMLPKGLPVLPRVELAARYLLAQQYDASGGDWFDAIPLADGRVVVVVGDVVGHGVEASVVMGELKALFDEKVREDGDVVAALEVLDRRASRLPAARATTVCACVVDPGSGEVTYCTAGHPPPVVVTRDGAASYLAVSGGRPLGTGPPVYPTARHTLDEGDVLMLYSDGLVERPGRSAAQNAVDLLKAAGDVVVGVGPVTLRSQTAVVERACGQLLDLLTRITGYADDITVLALQRVDEVEPVHLVLPAIPDSVRTTRADLVAWLERLHVSTADEIALLHGIAELVANAVEHAYAEPEVSDQVRVDVALDPTGAVDVQVADDGTWRDGPGGAGRGLALVRGLVDDFRLEHDEHGTRAQVRHRLSHPASLLRGVSGGAVLAEDGAHGFSLTIDGQQVRVAGVVERGGAALLQRTLRCASRGGTRPVSVDLSDVTLLTSAGVGVLVDAAADGEVALQAPAGSAAQRVLDLVHLPYTA